MNDIAGALVASLGLPAFGSCLDRFPAGAGARHILLVKGLGGEEGTSAAGLTEVPPCLPGALGGHISSRVHREAVIVSHPRGPLG